MKRSKKVVITIETHQVTIVRPQGKAIRRWCERCAAEAEMVKPEEAATLLGITPRDVYRRIENDGLHFVESDDGALLICKEDLP